MSSPSLRYFCRSSDEVLHILGNILGSLQRGRTSLIVPRKKTMDDLIKSRNMVSFGVVWVPLLSEPELQKSLSPNLSEDLAISFYIQSHKLIFAIYQLVYSHGEMKYESSHAECSVPWLNEVLVLFTVGLQLCQQLKDKVPEAAASKLPFHWFRCRSASSPSTRISRWGRAPPVRSTHNLRPARAPSAPPVPSISRFSRCNLCRLRPLVV